MTPQEMTVSAENAAIKKLNYTRKNLFILSVLGGAFIAFGGLFATAVSVGSTLPFGISRLIMGLVFSLGLILIVIANAELFTGSTVTSIAFFNKRISVFKLIKNWTVVYTGNMLGALIIAFLVFLGKEYLLSDGEFGEAIFKLADTKVHYNFMEAIVLGMLCNMLVCLAIWMSYSSKSVADKILAIILPISAFITLGFEHSVANMYLIPESLSIKYFDKAFLLAHAIKADDLNFYSFIIRNLVPVTLGNILGGIAIWFFYWKVYSEGKIDQA